MQLTVGWSPQEVRRPPLGAEMPPPNQGCPSVCVAALPILPVCVGGRSTLPPPRGRAPTSVPSAPAPQDPGKAPARPTGRDPSIEGSFGEALLSGPQRGRLRDGYPRLAAYFFRISSSSRSVLNPVHPAGPRLPRRPHSFPQRMPPCLLSLQPDPASWRNHVSCSSGGHLSFQAHASTPEEMPMEFPVNVGRRNARAAFRKSSRQELCRLRTPSHPVRIAALCSRPSSCIVSSWLSQLEVWPRIVLSKAQSHQLQLLNTGLSFEHPFLGRQPGPGMLGPMGTNRFCWLPSVFLSV